MASSTARGSQSLADEAMALISIPKAAKQLDVHSDTVRRMIATGDLPAYRIGPRVVRVAAADVRRLARPIPTVGTVGTDRKSA